LVPRPAATAQQIQKPRRDKAWEYRKDIANHAFG
jgi:hypothetical protein